MPNRILRDGILGSRAVNSLSDSGEIFYRRLMSVVDDYGRFEADPELLRARCFPRQLDRWPLSRVSEALSECSEARSSDGVPLITLYCSLTSEEKYCQINNFAQRIRVDKKGVPTPSKYPEPTEDGEARLNAAKRGDSPPKAYAYAYAKASAETGTRAPILSMPPAQDWDTRYRALYDRHIIPGFQQDGAFEYSQIISSAVKPDVTADAIDKSHAEWMEFFHENPDIYRPGIGKWLKEGYWTRRPKTREPTQPKSKYTKDIVSKEELAEYAGE